MWIFILVIIIVVCYIYVTYNNLTYLNKKTDKEFLDMDIFFKKRLSLLPNVINIFNSYNLEKETLNRITFLTKDDYDKQTIKDRIDMNIELNNLIDKLWEIADTNIILKQNPIFLNVIRQFNLVEDEIVTNKKQYNQTISKYNKKIKCFPSNIVAKMLKLEPKYLYNIDESTRRIIRIDSNNREVIRLEDKKEEEF